MKDSILGRVLVSLWDDGCTWVIKQDNKPKSITPAALDAMARLCLDPPTDLLDLADGRLAVFVNTQEDSGADAIELVAQEGGCRATWSFAPDGAMTRREGGLNPNGNLVNEG